MTLPDSGYQAQTPAGLEAWMSRTKLREQLEVEMQRAFSNELSHINYGFLFVEVFMLGGKLPLLFSWASKIHSSSEKMLRKFNAFNVGI